jgi:transcriptional regulator with XRE-family HTH domain
MVRHMETKDVLLTLRQKNNLTQDEMAEKLFVTRQAVSRWETGETVPNTDTLKIISKTFGVSINKLLGQPQNSTCQVCGSPLDDDNLSHEADGSVNVKYCKWCYIDGQHKYMNMEDVIADVVPHWNWGTPEQMQEFLRKQLVTLEYWQ